MTDKTSNLISEMLSVGTVLSPTIVQCFFRPGILDQYFARSPATPYPIWTPNSARYRYFTVLLYISSEVHPTTFGVRNGILEA